MRTFYVTNASLRKSSKKIFGEFYLVFESKYKFASSTYALGHSKINIQVQKDNSGSSSITR